jgi:DICT domain-containing protein
MGRSLSGGADHTPLAALDVLSLTERFSDEEMRLHSRSTMLALSFLIEDQAAAHAGTVVVAAFQRFSYFRPQTARYEQLTQRYRQAFVIGLPDAPTPSLPGCTFVALGEESPLVREWVVLALGPSFSVGLFAREPDSLQPGRRAREFTGTLVTEPDALDEIAATLERALGAHLTPRERNRAATRRAADELRRQLPAYLRRKG